MEQGLVLSMGSLIAFLGFLYTLHINSKKRTEEITDLKTRVMHLEGRVTGNEEVLRDLLTAVQSMQVTLTSMSSDIRHNRTELEQRLNSIDDKLSRLESDFRDKLRSEKAS